MLIDRLPFWRGGSVMHVPRVTPTDGVIVESIAVSGAWHRRLITYEYTAYGVRHRGQRLFGWGRSIPSTFYRSRSAVSSLLCYGRPRFQLRSMAARQDRVRCFRDHVRGLGHYSYLVCMATMTPNHALERTADRRVNLLLMTSTLNFEAPLAIVSGRSACSR
jgi:hypothetical protein